MQSCVEGRNLACMLRFSNALNSPIMRRNTLSTRPGLRIMGIRFSCPAGHQLHVKSFLAGKRGVCPKCGVSVLVPNVLSDESRPEVQAESISAAATTVANREAGRPGTPALDIGSQSVVISVVGPPTSVTPPPVPAPPLPSQPAPPTNLEVTYPQAVTPADVPPSLNAPPSGSVPQQLVMPESLETISPAASYVARRERNRRHRVTMAVCLLVAVILLAAVFVWVLQHAPSGAAENTPGTTSEYNVSPRSSSSIAAETGSNPLPKQVAS
jgi:hypothetical protein